MLLNCIWLSQYPAGAQGQSSIGKMTWCVGGVQKIKNLCSNLLLWAVCLYFGRRCPREKLSLSMKKHLTRAKKVNRFLLIFSFRFPLASREKLREISYPKPPYWEQVLFMELRATCIGATFDNTIKNPCKWETIPNNNLVNGVYCLLSRKEGGRVMKNLLPSTRVFFL